MNSHYTPVPLGTGACSQSHFLAKAALGRHPAWGDEPPWLESIAREPMATDAASQRASCPLLLGTRWRGILWRRAHRDSRS